MLATKYLFIALSLLISLVAAAPVPNEETIDYLVARTRTTAKKDATAAKKIMKQLDQKLSPPRDKALFWSGRVNGGSAMAPAQDYAKKNGKTTLEMGLKKANINMPAWGKSKQAPQLWDHASKLWAERSKGKTAAFLGQVRPQSVYNRIEKPALNKNTKVTQHTEHNLLKKATPKGPAGHKGKAAGHKGTPHKSNTHKAARKSTPQRASKPQQSTQFAAFRAKNTHQHKQAAKQAPKK
ncbi:hypothetical protein CPB83DRAFT_831782 [Crepidotus variabilis]|uniref:Uncharacterized protein n=1 Tax=Crepidotus variabilis TaxID=179855 RepID=A0A9P6ES75_9AGAR|nr:hypothetical protein CPB83DRAFT_831782 [Crepidotus variabilis]